MFGLTVALTVTLHGHAIIYMDICIICSYNVYEHNMFYVHNILYEHVILYVHKIYYVWLYNRIAAILHQRDEIFQKYPVSERDFG